MAETPATTVAGGGGASRVTGLPPSGSTQPRCAPQGRLSSASTVSRAADRPGAGRVPIATRDGVDQQEHERCDRRVVDRGQADDGQRRCVVHMPGTPTRPPMPMNARPPTRPASPPRNGGIHRGDRSMPGLQHTDRVRGERVRERRQRRAASRGTGRKPRPGREPGDRARLRGRRDTRPRRRGRARDRARRRRCAGAATPSPAR